jgi:carbon storage regulator
MLALSRKKGEALVFNNDIEVRILDVRGEQVKIGITAPSNISVYREEVYLQIQAANKEAAQNNDAVGQLENLLK